MENEDIKYVKNKLSVIGKSSISHVEFNRIAPQKDIGNIEIAEVYKKINAKNDKFRNWRDFSWIKEVLNEDSLLEAQSHEKSIIYFVANWCPQEKIGRHKIFSIIEELQTMNFQLYVIDTPSDQKKIIKHWLKKYSVDADMLMFRGYSEALLFKKNKFVDYITYAFHIKNNDLKRIITQWNVGTDQS